MQYLTIESSMLSSISLQYLRGTQKISLTCREFKDTISNEKKGREKEIDPVNEIVISGGTMENRRVRGALSATALIPAMAGNESPQFVRLKLSRHYAREFLLTFLHLSSTPSPPPSSWIRPSLEHALGPLVPRDISFWERGGGRLFA